MNYSARDKSKKYLLFVKSRSGIELFIFQSKLYHPNIELNASYAIWVNF